MEVSSTSIKVARVTVSATAQGLWLGFQSCMSGHSSLVPPPGPGKSERRISNLMGISLLILYQ